MDRQLEKSDNPPLTRRGRIHQNDLKILKCLDEALDTYGTSVKKVVYWNLEMMYGVQKESIPEQPEKFIETLERIFGSSASLVEATIIKHIAQLGDSVEISSGEDLSTVLKVLRLLKDENSFSFSD